MSARDEGMFSSSFGLSLMARLSVTLAGLFAALFVFGFLLFSAIIMRGAAPAIEDADAIIVLTGGDYRISEGARLLKEKRAQRMLISGVNAKVSRDDLIKISGLDADTFNCCVELGYAAQDTIGNAAEARTWVEGHAVKSAIIVTSTYHMPRSLAELQLSMPDVKLVADPVVPKPFREGAWWLNPLTARILLSEYVKYLPVAARLAVMRYLVARA